ncbi:diguanylate cyclase/phosphodiesterase (GGDEF & EAL domains) with PAS/PAC sensor(s) [hydrothermal vent metagenome]|uniref:Diguanylate cyclase/phosphodiesterase (GGDEF & EAL domains) with PAS/PAC sensor(S) n=1 Tax=hydrothermal vent metagenome TaxID=652676 RepID=A0A3B1B8Z7_9ZZZZ
MTPSKLNILLVEDDEDDYLIIKNMFERTRNINCDIDWISTYGEALDSMATCDCDVYLVDYRLGGGSGLDLLRKARERNCQKPIIILTGQGDHDVDVEAMEAGASDYLVKMDLNPQALERSIRYAINISQTIDTLQHARDELTIEVSERKKAEAAMSKAKKAAENASRIKSNFLSNISHEIRTPMCTIIGMSELLSESSLTKEQSAHVSTSIRAGNDLLHLIDEIIEISKLEADQVSLEELPFDFDDVFLKLASMFEKKAQRKGLQLVCSIDHDVPAKLIGDAEHLGSVLAKLLNNALKFTEQGEIAVAVKMAGPHEYPYKKESPVRITADGEELEECFLRFSVSDTGVGIPEHKINMIFDSFAQADTSSTREYGGAGLGITISKRVIEMMGGKIWVESEEGNGSTFFFTVRLWHCAGICQEPEALDVRLDGAKILLIDDSRTYRSNVEQSLAEYGCKVISVSNGANGLTALGQANTKGDMFDLVIVDHVLPEMDGVALIKQIRMNGEWGNCLPVLILCAYCSYCDAEKANEVGAVGCVMKPVRVTSLIAAITQSMKRKTGVCG